jgi:hypothetical protein
MGNADVKEQLEVAIEEVGKLERELERLHSWDGLMELLDEHWPASMIPTREDTDGRDTGPRIVSLMRWLDMTRAERDDALKQLAALMSHLDHWDAEHDRVVI